MQIAGGRHHRGFGGAIGVDQAGGWRGQALPGRQLLGVHRLATDDHALQPSRHLHQAGAQGHHPFVPEGGRQVEHADRQLLEALDKGADRLQQRIGTQHQGRAGAEADKHLLDAGVEVERGELQHAVRGSHAIAQARRLDKMIQRAVADFHTLGRTAGAGGEHQVGRHLALTRCAEAMGAVQHAGQFDRAAVAISQAMAKRRLGDHQGQLRGGANQSLTLAGLLRIERHIHRPGQQHAELHNNHLEAAAEHHPDPLARLYATFTQRGGEGFGLRLQFTVTELALALAQRQVLRL
ncbi:hypothetical protein D3C84_390310 [compost metagenome]